MDAKSKPAETWEAKWRPEGGTGDQRKVVSEYAPGPWWQLYRQIYNTYKEIEPNQIRYARAGLGGNIFIA